MICWGEKDCCGVFVDQKKDDRCNCLRDTCIRDFEPSGTVMVNEHNLEAAIDSIHLSDEDHFQELDSMLQIRSISNSVEHESQTKQIIDRLTQRLTELDFHTEVVKLKGTVGQARHYVLFANYFSTPAKQVVLVYGNVDVPPVSTTDPWKHEPFQLTDDNGLLYGRGLTSSKGPVLCWIQTITAWMTANNELPVNLRLVIDSNQDASSQARRALFDSRKDFFKSVDLLVSTTNLWIAERVPMLTTCHSGFIYFELEVRKKTKAATTAGAHNRRSVNEPMAELCMLMNTLTDAKHGMLVKGLQRHVLPVTQHDWDIFYEAEVGIQEYKQRTGATQLAHEQSKPVFLKHRWCMPSLTMHGVKNQQTVSERDFHVPNAVTATFSVKLVPTQSVEYAHFVVRDHLERAYARLKCQHPAYLRVVDQIAPLNELRTAAFTVAAYQAYEKTYGVKSAIPDTVNVCMPIMNELRRYCMKTVQVVGLPFCSIHMRRNQVNEVFTRYEYEKNLELFATFLYEVALVPPQCKCTAIRDFCYKKGKSTDTDFRLMMEMRELDSHVLYEIDENEIDRTTDINKVMPDAKTILLGVNNSRYLD